LEVDIFGIRHFGIRHFGRSHFGSQHFGSWHFGSRHFFMAPTESPDHSWRNRSGFSVSEADIQLQIQAEVYGIQRGEGHLTKTATSRRLWNLKRL
jgi:hypothetical protein